MPVHGFPFVSAPSPACVRRAYPGRGFWPCHFTGQPKAVPGNDNSLAANQIKNDNSLAANQIKNDNNLSKNEIDAAWNNSQREINTANKNADDIMNSYDHADQDAGNARFDASQKQLQETEDSLFGDAAQAFAKLDLSQYALGSFANMTASLSFVSGFLQSLYQKMGAFGLVVTIGMVVMVASKVIGLYRFSTGGDP